ncbi:MAG: hypothetical protein JXQ73_10105 [Phycisphaerae bacterium]|nr:hypothetical protein [Phycisphaerae bacterium]
MKTTRAIVKSLMVVVLAGVSAGACGPCCFDPGPHTDVAAVFTGIHDPPVGVVNEAVIDFTTYAMLVEGCEAEWSSAQAQAWVNDLGPIELDIALEDVGVEGCAVRTQLTLTGELTLTPGANEVRVNVTVDVGLGEPDVDVDEYVTYEYLE